MATSQQSRVPGQSAIQTANLSRNDPATGGAALSVRLWRAHGTAEPKLLRWEGSDPAVSLTLDLIAASLGVVSTTQGASLLAEFSGIQSALLTARRLQWAIQGLSEADRFAGTAVAILVLSASDLPGLEADKSALLPLERATPGQTLLTPKTAELLRNLPGLPLQAASEGGLEELLWSGSERTSSRSTDEDAIAQLIKLHGLENEAPPLLQPISQPPVLLHGEEGPLPLAEPVETVRRYPDVAAFPRTLDRRLLIGAASAVLIVIGVLTAVAVSHSRTAAPVTMAVQPVPSTPAAPPSAALPPQTQPANFAPSAAAGNGTGVAKHNTQTQKDRGTEKPAQSSSFPSDSTISQLNKQKAASPRCDLDPNLIPKALDQAEKSRDQGNYDAAVRQFRSVLACEPDNARARSGLERVLFAKETAK